MKESSIESVTQFTVTRHEVRRIIRLHVVSAGMHGIRMHVGCSLLETSARPSFLRSSAVSVVWSAGASGNAHHSQVMFSGMLCVLGDQASFGAWQTASWCRGQIVFSDGWSLQLCAKTTR